MADDIKFTEEEMKSLGELQDSYTKKQAELGQVSVQRILLNQQLDNLDQRQSHLEKEYVQVQQQEQDLVKELNEKYGAGQLDPESGVFTPNNS
jgi:chromosome segregation ATPase